MLLARFVMCSDWARLSGPPRRPPPRVDIWASSVRETVVPKLGWNGEAWPTDMKGVCYYDVAAPGENARHGDFVHLRRVCLLSPHVEWNRDPITGKSWLGLMPRELVLLDGPNCTRLLRLPPGTHVTIAKFIMHEDTVVRRIAEKATEALKTAPRIKPPHIMTICVLPAELDARPNAGFPDLVLCDYASELADVLKWIRRALKFASISIVPHMRFGLRACDVETSAVDWQRSCSLNSMD